MAGHAETREEAALLAMGDRVDAVNAVIASLERMIRGVAQRTSTLAVRVTAIEDGTPGPWTPTTDDLSDRISAIESRLPRLPGPTHADLEGLHEEVAELTERVTALEGEPSPTDWMDPFTRRLTAELATATKERDEARAQAEAWRAGSKVAKRERDEALRTAAQATDCLAAARAELLDTRRELGTARADRDRWRDVSRVWSATASSVARSTLPPLTDKQRREMAADIRRISCAFGTEGIAIDMRRTADLLDPPTEMSRPTSSPSSPSQPPSQPPANPET